MVAMGFLPTVAMMCRRRQRGMSSLALQELYTIEERPVDLAELTKAVSRHFEHAAVYDSAKPLATHTIAAFEDLAVTGPTIIDGGCGRGRSTLKVAAMHPDRLVVGVDRSAVRLDKAERRPQPPNAVFIRAELADFWRLLAASRFTVDHTLLLYPNPYPKREHLKRRWHGHPVFPWLLGAAGDGLTLRASWKTYLDEFLAAVHIASDLGDPNARRLLTPDPVVRTLDSSDHPENDGLTHFEAKYFAARVPVYELQLGQSLDLHRHPSSS